MREYVVEMYLCIRKIILAFEYSEKSLAYMTGTVFITRVERFLYTLKLLPRKYVVI